MDTVIFGGRGKEEAVVVLEFPLKGQEEPYELPVDLKAVYQQQRNNVMGEVARYKKKSGMPYFHLGDTDRLNAKLLLLAVRGWADVDGVSGNPVGLKCTACSLWVINQKQAKMYEIAACECKRPKIKQGENGPVGHRLPHDRLWPLYVIHQLQGMLDPERMPKDEDGDPKRAIDVVMDAANDLAYPGSNNGSAPAVHMVDDEADEDATASESREIAEGNLLSSPGSELSTEE